MLAELAGSIISFLNKEIRLAGVVWLTENRSYMKPGLWIISKERHIAVVFLSHYLNISEREGQNFFGSIQKRRQLAAKQSQLINRTTAERTNMHFCSLGELLNVSLTP